MTWEKPTTTPQRKSRQTATMSAMDLDAPVSIASQFREQQQNGAT
jgi:hypothetical protein